MVNKKYKCPECHSKKFIYDWKHAETVCTECGMVIEAPYPYTAGHRVFYPQEFNYSLAYLDIHYAHTRNINKNLKTFFHNAPNYKIVYANRKPKNENDNHYIFNR